MFFNVFPIKKMNRLGDEDRGFFFWLNPPKKREGPVCSTTWNVCPPAGFVRMSRLFERLRIHLFVYSLA